MAYDAADQGTSGGVSGAHVERLCAAYDCLLEPSGAVSAEAEQELKALARIFDLDAERPAGVWRTSTARTEGHSSPAAAPAFEPMTVLLVEDDAIAAADLTAALGDAGHRVVGPFHSAEAAEAATALYPIDLALLDINLSGEATGVDLARSLKARWGVPVIFLSGDVTAAAHNAELAAAMVIKPYRGREVLDAIARLEPVA